MSIARAGRERCLRARAFNLCEFGVWGFRALTAEIVGLGV